MKVSELYKWYLPSWFIDSSFEINRLDVPSFFPTISLLVLLLLKLFSHESTWIRESLNLSQVSLF